jgi:diaminopimelate epimerase
LQTFERGCGLTLACGSGACGTYVVGVKKKIVEGRIDVRVEGGVLKVGV